MRDSGGKSRSGYLSGKRLVLMGGAAFAAVLLVLAIIFAIKWPFRRGDVIARISGATGAKVSIGSFNTTYFPPGFIAENAVLTKNGNGAPVFTARRVQVRTSYSALLHRRLGEVRIAGFELRPAQLHVASASPPDKRGASAAGKSGGSIRIDLLVAENGMISVPIGGRPAVVSIQRFTLTGIGEPASTFQIAIRFANPPGAFSAAGKADGIGLRPLARVPVKGHYSFSDVRLGAFRPVGGNLASTGKLGGTLAHVQFDGSAIVPDFRASQGPHRVRVETAYTAVVDTTNADVALPRVQTSFDRTVVLATGSIGPNASGADKALRLRVQVNRGRIGDLLTLFTGNNRPAMTGSMRLNGNIEVTSVRNFLRSLKIDGMFEIRDAVFTNPKTESVLSRLSESARGETRADLNRQHAAVPAVFRGRVDDARGIARFSDVEYATAGVDASVHGTFNLVTKSLNMRGILATTGKVGEAESRLKSVFLFAARPFLAIRRRRRITYVAFRIRGSSRKPAFAILRSAPQHKP